MFEAIYELYQQTKKGKNVLMNQRVRNGAAADLLRRLLTTPHTAASVSR